MFHKTPFNRIRIFREIIILFSFIGLILLLPGRDTRAAPPPPAAVSTISNIDSVHVDSFSSSIALNNQGFPVISFYDTIDDTGDNGELRIAVCKDAECTNPSLNIIDASTRTHRPSLKLNTNGFPVIAYENGSFVEVYLAVCNDSDCTNPTVGKLPLNAEASHPSLVLRDDNRPIISYYHESSSGGDRDLKIAVCDTELCTDPDLITIDSAGIVGQHSSIALNDSDLPVISYYDYGLTGNENQDLKLAVCNSINCDIPVIRTVDSVGSVGRHTSLVLNNLGNPVISYYDATNGDLKLAVCNDPTCGVKTILTVDSAGNTGSDTSLSLNSKGFAVISYRDVTNEKTKVAVCNDANCSNPTLTTVEGNITSKISNTSLALNSIDIPVISFVDRDNGIQKMAICNMCVSPELTTVDSTGNVGTNTSLALQENGNPVISYVEINTALKVAVCDDPLCTSRTPTTVDDSGWFVYTSLALNSNGFPVISYYDTTDADLELAICRDRTCTNPILKTVDSEDRQGKYPSLVINDQGFAVMSYYDETDFDLKLAVCKDAECTNPSINMVDGVASFVGEYSSLVLNSNGYPVISYYSSSGSDLKLAICNDDTCSTPPTLRILDQTGSVGKHTSLVLNSQGFPVVSYYDETEDDLKLAVCNNATCTQPTVVTVDTVGDVGRYSSLTLTSSDTPIISYFDNINKDLKVAVCNDNICTTSTLTTVDHPGFVGDYSSMKLNNDGYPVISYYDGSPNVNLKLAVFEPPTPVYRINIPLIIRNSQ